MIKKLLKSLLFLVLAIPVLFRRNHPVFSETPPSSQKPGWKRWLVMSAVLLVLMHLGGFLVATEGIISIKASSGHWAVTRWFLNFAKERSVTTHTLGKKAPPLDAPWMAVKGATHYETGCRSCHGSPDTPQPHVAKRMTPPPPSLASINSKFEPVELFYIIKHGIKFTGMPAWPAEKRDDEVWAMVAFLLIYPEMGPADYPRLALGETTQPLDAPIRDLLPPEKAPQAISESCARCHGPDGLGRGVGAFPKLAGQKPDYILASLHAYASGKRSSGIMEPIAAGLSAEAMRELAEYYGKLTRSNRFEQPQNDPAAIERGRRIAQNGIPNQKVPACLECHSKSIPRNSKYPVLSGQYPEYLILQLDLFNKKVRGGTPYSHLMHFVAGGLTTAQMSDVAEYFGSLSTESEVSRLSREQ